MGRLNGRTKMDTILVTGSKGQLGSSLRSQTGTCSDYRFLFADIDTLDICDKRALESFVKENKVNYIINCAAYTAVERAEEDKEKCESINHNAVKNIAEAALTIGAKVFHISTDYVFDGRSCVPYKEGDAVCPISIYGKTKRQGEEELLRSCPDTSIIIRTAWLYSEFGNNFMKTMLRLGAERTSLPVVFDQVGTPTCAYDLASALLSILDQSIKGLFIPGIYHYSNEGVCSWYDFAVKIMQLAGLPAKVFPIESDEYPTKAARPHYSVLNKSRIKSVYNLDIPHWEQSLVLCLNRLKELE